jgi:hypothetical protein
MRNTKEERKKLLEVNNAEKEELETRFADPDTLDRIRKRFSNKKSKI